MLTSAWRSTTQQRGGKRAIRLPAIRWRLFVAVLALTLPGIATAADVAGRGQSAMFQTTPPDHATALRLFPGATGPLAIARHGSPIALWTVADAKGPVGLIASTWELSASVGYSGRPIDILVAITPAARIAGAILQQHNEPIFTLGITTEHIARYVGGFTGFDLTAPRVEAFKDSAGLPPIIAGATVSTGVIRDAILRTARTAALSQGFIATASAAIDRVAFAPKTWSALAAEGALAHASLDNAAAARQFGQLREPFPEGGEPFVDLWVAVLDPPSIGRNLLGEMDYSRIMAGVGPADAAILIGGTSFHSHRGTGYIQSGVFDRLELIQGARTIKLKREDYLRVDKLPLADAPPLREVSVFRVPAATGFKPADPFRVEVIAEAERADGSTATIRTAAPYTLPKAYRYAAITTETDEPAPLWVEAWRRKPFTIAVVAVMVVWVAGAFFVQEFFVARPRLWLWGRLGFLTFTVLFLGLYAKGQLSVVQVVAFLQSLLHGFRWETFLIEPVIFMLWSFVALGLLFWGRGVYCGWLCPFGALQELLNEAAKKFGVTQIEVPFAIQERLWAIKYALFMLILGLSFYSMDTALKVAEVEPFKTVTSMWFNRAWPFVLFALSLLAAGLFIERFYCRYLCPLGAALAIPAKMKLFDWLHRRPQCGRECRFCETQCTVGAIDTLGRINPNECILCLRCQVIMNDDAQCVVLKKRAARGSPPAQAQTRGD